MTDKKPTVEIYRGGRWQAAEVEGWSVRDEWDGSIGPNYEMPNPPWRVLDSHGKVLFKAPD